MRVFISPTELELKEENVISIKRISKATTGGRSMRFNCVVAVGDGNGHVGIGFGKAIDISLKTMQTEYEFLRKLRDLLYDGIVSKHSDIILNGSFENGLPNNLNLCFPELDSETMIMKMKGIACSAGSACSSANLEPSHVIKALGRPNELALSAIRFSLGRFNTEREVETAIKEINRVAETLKLKKIKRKNKKINH